MDVRSYRKAPASCLLLALLMIGAGVLMAHKIQTNGGIEVREVRYPSSDGRQVSALLYIPPAVSSIRKAPGIVATHGYMNSRETQDGFAIEFARRGFVVLAPDQPGHGYSDPPAFANGFGGLDSLKYLRSLDFVDRNNIGLEGHSMGGWASVFAASADPDGYKSMVLASSSTGTYGAPAGSPTFPRNLALIFSEFDEFSGLMWESPVAKDIVASAKLKQVFGVTETVEIGKLYGSIAEGTARKLYQPALIHPRVHFSTEAIGEAMEWMQLTLEGGAPLDPSDQIWYWKEIGTLLAMIGMVLLIFPLGDILMGTPYFRELRETPPERKSLHGTRWWFAAVITTLLPVPFYIVAWDYHGKGIAKASLLWPQQITTTIMLSALGVSLASLVLFVSWHFSSNRRKSVTLAHYGLGWDLPVRAWRKIGKSFLLSALLITAAYLTLLVASRGFQVDYRFWVFAIKPLSPLQFSIFLRYFLPFLGYFLILGVVLHGQMRRDSGRSLERVTGREMLANAVLLLSGFLILLVYLYQPLFSGGSIGRPGFELAAIVLFQFIPIFMIVAFISTFFYRRTGHVFVGAFTNAMLVTWIIVAGQATHFAL